MLLDPKYDGYVDSFQNRTVIGWARGPSGERPVLRIRVNGSNIGFTTPTKFRPDLVNRESDGYYGFEYPVPDSVGPIESVSVTVVASGLELAFSDAPPICPKSNQCLQSEWRGGPNREKPKPGINTTEGAPAEYHVWYYTAEIWKTTTFLGIPCLKSVSDMWNYQEILTELKPSLILEFGTRYGGSTLYFAELLKAISPRFRVLSVDLDHSAVAPQVLQHEYIELFQSDTTNDAVASRFRELRRSYPGKAFVIVDSDHRKEHVFDELMLLRGVTEPGDYVVVEDGNLNGHPVCADWGPGPFEALEDYRRQYQDDYVLDTARELKFGFTFAPSGFLIRR